MIGCGDTREVFLTHAMKAGFIYQANDPITPFDTICLATGGCSILSRFPIVATGFYPYIYSQERVCMF